MKEFIFIVTSATVLSFIYYGILELIKPKVGFKTIMQVCSIPLVLLACMLVFLSGLSSCARELSQSLRDFGIPVTVHHMESK